MKRFLTFAAAALITTTSAFAGWGPNGQYGNAIPGSTPVGQSSTPSSNPASAPILNPTDPTKPSKSVPGSLQDKADKGQIPTGWGGYNPNSPIYNPNKKTTNTTSSRPSRERHFPTTQTNSYPHYPANQGGYGQNSGNNGGGYGGTANGGFFGNDVGSRQRPTNNYPTNMNNYPQQTQYPTNTTSGYPKGNNYPQQHNSPASGYGTQSSSAGWGGYGGQASSGSSSWGPSNSGYGGQASTSNWGGYGGQPNSQYGMFNR